MPTFAILPFPSALVGTRPIRLENDFTEGPIAAAFAPDGSLHVLSELVYDAARFKEPPANDLRGHYLTRFDAALGSPRLTMLDRVTAAVGTAGDALVDLALVAGGWLIMARSGRSWVVADDGAIVRAFAVDDRADLPRMYRENFAARAAVRPDGRLVVGVAEAGPKPAANVIAVSIDPHPTFEAGQPRLRYLTSLENIDDVGAEIPYVRLGNGKPFVDRDRPKPTLADVKGNPGHGGWLGGLCALSNVTTLVAVYSRFATFQLALVDDAGAFIGELDLDGDTPYKDDHHVVAADQRHARVIFKSKAHLHVFDERGNTIKRIDLTDEAFKPLAAFHLLGASPSGEILLCHRRHHTLLLVDPTPEIKRQRETLAAASAHYKTAWAAAKKVHKPVNGHWVHSA